MHQCINASLHAHKELYVYIMYFNAKKKEEGTWGVVIKLQLSSLTSMHDC